jgi:hypothetical protein
VIMVVVVVIVVVTAVIIIMSDFKIFEVLSYQSTQIQCVQVCQ